MNTPVNAARAEPRARRITGWTLAWTAWILFFLVVEFAALFRRAPGDTFSEHWWSLFRLRERVPVPVRVALLAVQVGFGIWLVGHLAFGWWTW